MKTFLSIGSGSGIGYATAERFAREGFEIILSARNLDRTLQLVQRLKAKGYSAQARIVDASNTSDIIELIHDIEMAYGSIDVLHYNAASLRQATISEQPTETFNSDLATNIGGALTAAQASLPNMRLKQSGTILLTGGFFAISPNPDYLSLSLGKAGIRALAFGLFESSKVMGIHVATVTVATHVQPNSKEATEIAEKFWELYTQPQNAWTEELTYAP